MKNGDLNHNSSKEQSIWLHIFGFGGVVLAFIFAFRAFPKQIKTMRQAKSVVGLNNEQFVFNIFAQICAIGYGVCIGSWYIVVPSAVIAVESMAIAILYVYYHNFYTPKNTAHS